MEFQPTTASILHDPNDFSLVLGGPLYQLWRRTRMAGEAMQLVRRRIIGMLLVAWLPLLALSIAEGTAWGGRVKLPFFRDLEMNTRLLVALPLLIVAEMVVHQRMRRLVRQFVEHGLIPDAAKSRFDKAVASALRLRDSMTAEILLMLFVYCVGVLFVWRTSVAIDLTAWYGVAEGGKLQPSLAGWWMGLISLPLFQFLLLRWYFRLFIWARLMWQVSRIPLKILPTHPDHCGGLGFLAPVCDAFAPVLLAQGTLLAGMMANRIFYRGAKLTDFKLEIIGLVAVMVLAVLGPLLVFTFKLAAAKRAGIIEYGALAHRYVQEFDDKWLRGGAPPDEPFIGSADIQSLADMGNSFATVEGMRVTPFGIKTVLELAVITLLPVMPLLLTVVPMEELLGKLLKLLF
jgi:hypothetical protein